MRRVSFVAAAAVLCVLAACKDSAGPAAANFNIVSGDSQAVLTGDTLPGPLIVRATNSAGEGVAGVPVTWSTGNGTFLTMETTTGPNGTASATMRAGNTPAGGAATATAGSGDNLVGFVVFSVRILDRCEFPVSLTLGATVNGVITANDCAAVGDGSFLDNFSFTTATAQRIMFAMSSAEVDAYLWVRQGLRTIAANDDTDNTTTNASLSVLLAAADWTVWANTFAANDLGAYQLQTTIQPLDIEDCARIWTSAGVTAAQTLPAAPCDDPAGGTTTADYLAIIVGSLDTIRIATTAAGFAGRTRIWVNGAVADSGIAAGAGQTATATFGVPSGSFGSILLEFSSATGGDAGGAYTLSVTRSGPNAAPMPLPRRTRSPAIGRISPTGS